MTTLKGLHDSQWPKISSRVRSCVVAPACPLSWVTAGCTGCGCTRRGDLISCNYAITLIQLHTMIILGTVKDWDKHFVAAFYPISITENNCSCCPKNYSSLQPHLLTATWCHHWTSPPTNRPYFLANGLGAKFQLLEWAFIQVFRPCHLHKLIYCIHWKLNCKRGSTLTVTSAIVC